MCVLLEFYVYTAVAVQLNMCVQYGSHICLVMYGKYVQSAPCYVSACSDFYMIHISVCIFHYKPIKYLAYMPWAYLFFTHI